MDRLKSEEMTEFWQRVKRGPPNSCWEWQGGVNGDGYGYFKQHRAHRLAFSFAAQRQPINLVLHRCNNRLCCNPRHLYDGTHKDNMADMSRAGRHDGPNRRGERHPCARLTRRDVALIRESGDAGVILAKKFGVSQATISQIRNRKQWIYE